MTVTVYSTTRIGSPAQTAPGLDCGRHRGNPPPAHPGLRLELLEQHPEHLAVTGSRTEPQSQHEVQRHPGGQGTAADLPAAALLDHLVHQPWRKELRHRAEPEPVQGMPARISRRNCGRDHIPDASMQIREAS